MAFSQFDAPAAPAGAVTSLGSTEKSVTRVAGFRLRLFTAKRQKRYNVRLAGRMMF